MKRWWKRFSPLPSLLWLILFSAPSLCAKWVSICSLFAPFPFVVSLTPPCPRQPAFASENWFLIWEGSYQNPPNPLTEGWGKCSVNNTHLAISMLSFPIKNLLFFFIYRREKISESSFRNLFSILSRDTAQKTWERLRFSDRETEIFWCWYGAAAGLLPSCLMSYLLEPSQSSCGFLLEWIQPLGKMVGLGKLAEN